MYAHPAALLLIIPSCLYLGLTVYVSRFVKHRAARLFLCFILSLAIYALASMFELMSWDFDTMLWWIRIKYLGIALFPVFWMMLVLRKHAKFPAILAIFALPVLSIGLVWTTPSHGLFFSSLNLSVSRNLSLLVFERGIGFYALTGFTVLLYAFSLFWCVLHRRELSDTDRRSYFFLHTATFLMILPMGLDLAGIRLFPQLDPVPYISGLSAFIMIFALFRYEVFQISPVARMRLIEALKDPFLVIDMQNIVIDFNTGFETLFGTVNSETRILGSEADTIYKTLHLSTENIRMSYNGAVDWEHRGRHYELQTFQVSRGERMRGFIHYFHDYTDRKRYEQQLRLSLLRLEKLNDLSRVLSMWLGKGDMTKVTMDTATELLDAVFGALFFLESGGLHERARSGIEKTEKQDSPIDILLQEAAFEAITAAETAMITRPPYNVIAVPLNAEILHGQPGALVFVKSEESEFSSFDKSLAESVARQLAVTVETARLYREVERRAQVDGLTSVYTRRHFESLAKHEYSYSVRHKRPFCIIMTDIDFFKKVNDTHGHPAGDAVLRQVAERLRVNLREADLLGRYGGEEFVILLPATPAKTAMIVAERVHNAIRSKTISIGTGEIEVTASFGMSEYIPGVDTGLETVVKRADQALYDAKNSGRNCIRFKQAD